MTGIRGEEIKPVSFKERIVEIDILRGFALFGVLLVNMAMFNTTLYSEMVSAAPLSDPLQLKAFWDRLTGLFIIIFAQGKFYTIFSLLFGLGFFIFTERAEKKGVAANRLFKRRAFFLLLFGLVHFLLVWYGDILHIYGLIGFLLIPFRNCNLKTLKRWIIFFLVLSTLLYGTLGFLNTMIEVSSGWEESNARYLPLMRESIDVYKNGSYIDVIKYRFTKEFPIVLSNLIVIIPKVLGMFLIGLYIGKKGILMDIDGNFYIIKKTWKICGVVGVLFTVGYILLQWQIVPIDLLFQDAMIITMKEIATVFLSLFYASSLLLLLRKPSLRKRLMPLRFLGQMALTNYLVQCITCSLIFYGYGLGLLNEIGLTVGLLFTIGIYTLQIVLSKIWLKHFKYGAFEWIWRKMTYGGL